MKAYELEQIGQLVYKEVAKPVLHQGEVLVEVLAAGICGSDIPRIYETGTYHFPLIPGHEFAGRVVEVSDLTDERWIGKRVGVFPLIPCKTCQQCTQKEYEMCSDYNYLGSRCDGGFAEYVAVPVWNLIEIPNEMSMKEAAMLEPAAVALHALRRVALHGDTTVALFGLGTIGCIMTQWLADYGVKNVYAIGHHTEYGELMKKTANDAYSFCDAKTDNAREWVLDRTKETGVDLVIDCINSSKSLEDDLLCVRPKGQILMVGNPHAEIAIDKNIYWKLLRKQVTVVGTWNSSFTKEEQDDWHQTILACVENRLSLTELITHEFPFEDLEKGLRVMREKNVYRNKVMVVKK
ncbi:MAG TPA: galactitol-1-phosphate 5-dehydrogenase [Lachnospiraceae bacterium]|nr:galactitol-1-phosphate 5-dehydrogenase [Lachnospiraceae bacterium]HPF29481.1 galactitol-1-phosphate 5-dehydrogenase [Lachnospiraceae bacterium]